MLRQLSRECTARRRILPSYQIQVINWSGVAAASSDVLDRVHGAQLHVLVPWNFGHDAAARLCAAALLLWLLFHSFPTLKFSGQFSNAYSREYLLMPTGSSGAPYSTLSSSACVRRTI